MTGLPVHIHDRRYDPPADEATQAEHDLWDAAKSLRRCYQLWLQTPRDETSKRRLLNALADAHDAAEAAWCPRQPECHNCDSARATIRQIDGYVEEEVE